MAYGVPSPFGSLLLNTPQDTTGSFASVNDAPGPSSGASQILSSLPQGAFPTMLGSIWPTKDSSGNCVVYKYVKWNPASGTGVSLGSPVYYTDLTRTVVSDLPADAATYKASSDSSTGSFAGVSLATNGSPPTTGNGIWIQVGGFFTFDATNAMSASVVKGDRGVLAGTSAATVPTIDKWTKIAAGTVLTVIDSAAVTAYCLSATTAFLVNGLGWA